MTFAAILQAATELTPQEQNCLINEIVKAQRSATKKPYGLAKKYISILCDIMDIEYFDIHERNHPFVWVKAMCAYQLYRDGLTMTEIGKMIGMDHASVGYYIGKMDNAFSIPKAYKREMEIWVEFIKRIKDETI